jgi:sucrose-6-phosphatase
MLLLSTDIDGTVFDGPESAQTFHDCWRAISRHHPNALLSYNTGRAFEDARRLVESQPLPTPDFFICGVGTVIYNSQSDTAEAAWADQLSASWDLHAAHHAVASSTPAAPQPPGCQGPHKSSWFWENADQQIVESLISQLSDQGIAAQAIYSSNRDLDLLPASANKGNALVWLAAQLEIPHSQIIVAGDSANDSSMFLTPGVRGIAVANAESALVDAIPRTPNFFFATLPCAAGVAQGLHHFLPNELAPPHPDDP